MNEKNSNLLIGLLSIVGALIMLLALSLAIGRWSFLSNHHRVQVRFPIVEGIDVHSEVKLAGAPVGHVLSIHLLTHDEQDLNPNTRKYNYVVVTAELDDNQITIGSDFKALVKQDGLGIAPKYLLLVPGPDRNALPLTESQYLQGEEAHELTDLAQPMGEALDKANRLLDNLGGAFTKLDSLREKTDHLVDDMSQTLTKAGPLVDDTEVLEKEVGQFLADFDSPSERAKINKLLTNLGVVTDNLKVVSSNSKALTKTLAENHGACSLAVKQLCPHLKNRS